MYAVLYPPINTLQPSVTWSARSLSTPLRSIGARTVMVKWWNTGVPYLGVKEKFPTYRSDWQQISVTKWYAIIIVVMWNWKHKISPVGDWRSTSLEWRFSILDPWIVWHFVEHHSPTFAYVAILSRIKLNFYRTNFLPSSKSRDTKTRINIKNPARSNLDIVL